MAGLSLSVRSVPETSPGIAEVHALGPRISRNASHPVESYRITGLPLDAGTDTEFEFVMSLEGGRIYAAFGNGRWVPSADADGEAFTLYHHGVVTVRQKIEVLRSRRHVGRWLPDKQRHQILTYQTPASLGLRAAFELTEHVRADQWRFR